MATSNKIQANSYTYENIYLHIDANKWRTNTNNTQMYIYMYIRIFIWIYVCKYMFVCKRKPFKGHLVVTVYLWLLAIGVYHCLPICMYLPIRSVCLLGCRLAQTMRWACKQSGSLARQADSRRLTKVSKDVRCE